MGMTIEFTERDLRIPRNAVADRHKAAAQRRDRIACAVAAVALVALLVAGIALRVVMFVPH
jgi:hypothetical protein